MIIPQPRLKLHSLKVRLFVYGEYMGSGRSFRCINSWLMAQSKGVDVKENMNEKDKVDYIRNQERKIQAQVLWRQSVVFEAATSDRVGNITFQKAGKLLAQVLVKGLQSNRPEIVAGLTAEMLHA
ncbi:hypothetical protein Tco_0920956 [Tanacetum coccineum]